MATIPTTKTMDHGASILGWQQEWERRPTVFGLSRTGTSVITAFFPA